MNHKKEEIYLNLGKLSEEEIKEVYFLFPKECFNAVKITLYHQYLHFDTTVAKDWFTSLFNHDKTEITYPEFIKLFEGGEGETKVDIYSGELNTERILTYKKLSEQYNIEESTVRDIFNAGAEWVNKLNSNQ